MSHAATITGLAAADAEARRTARDRWVLRVDLVLPTRLINAAAKGPATARVLHDYGTGPSAAIACKERARQIRRGVRVQAAASAVRIRAGRLELDPIAWLALPDIDAAHRARYEREEATA